MSERMEQFNRYMVSWALPHFFYRINIDCESRKNAKLIKENLADNKDKSYAILWNHTVKTDFVGVSCVQKLIDPNTPRNLVTLASYSHMKGDLEAKKMMNVFRRCGVEVIPVIQACMAEYFTEAEIKENYKNILKRFYELKNDEKPTGLLIAPEGHRSEDGNLGKIERGVIKFVEILEPVICIPARVVFEGKYDRDGLNFGKNVEIQIREPIDWKKGEPKITVEQISLSLK